MQAILDTNIEASQSQIEELLKKQLL